MNQINYREYLDPKCKINQADLPAIRGALWSKATDDANELHLLTGEMTAIPNYDAFTDAKNPDYAMLLAIDEYRNICNSLSSKLEAAKLTVINAAIAQRAAAVAKPAPAPQPHKTAQPAKATRKVKIDADDPRSGSVEQAVGPNLTERILKAKGVTSIEQLGEQSRQQPHQHAGSSYIPRDPMDDTQEPKGYTKLICDRLGVRNIAELRAKRISEGR